MTNPNSTESTVPTTCDREGCDERFDGPPPNGCVDIQGDKASRFFCSHACLDTWLHYSAPEELASIFAGRYVPPAQQAAALAQAERDAQVEAARRIIEGR